jgi:hypothetical protein
MIVFVVLVLLTVCDTATASCTAVPLDDPLTVSKAWWNAFSTGDVAYLTARTTRSASVTLNNGRGLNREELLADAVTHAHATVGATWSDEVVRELGEGAVAVTVRVTETVGSRVAHYRYISVLQCNSGTWQIAVAQSTRELRETVRVPISIAGNLQDFAGEYRTPAGKTVQLFADASGLLLVDPSGARTRLEPIGPALFEAGGISVQGLIRFSFVRNTEGAVVALNRVATEVITFPRIASSIDGGVQPPRPTEQGSPQSPANFLLHLSRRR